LGDDLAAGFVIADARTEQDAAAEASEVLGDVAGESV
jgi:hypothetical protein